MAPQTKKVVDPSLFTADVVEFIRCLYSNDVRFMIVGGEAVIFYGHARLTGDVDFFYDLEISNTERLYKALRDFWSSEIPTLTDPRNLLVPGKIFQFGIPPNRIDLLNQIDGITFADAWPNRSQVILDTEPDSVPFSIIGLEDLILNKSASGRHKDLEDLRYLRDAQTVDSE